jgi:hypothetical protein
VSIAVLVLVDLTLIALHLWHRSWRTSGREVPEWVKSRDLSLEEDRGLAELVNYVELSIAAVLLLASSVARRRATVLAAWALAMVVAVADDALRLHERWGAELAYQLALPQWFGLRERDFGELLVWGGFAATLLPLLALAHRGSDRWARAVSWRMVVLLGALFFFAAGVDLLHIPFRGTAPGRVLATVEDAGEIVVSTFFLVVAIAAATTSWGAREQSVA